MTVFTWHWLSEALHRSSLPTNDLYVDVPTRPLKSSCNHFDRRSATTFPRSMKRPCSDAFRVLGSLRLLKVEFFAQNLVALEEIDSARLKRVRGGLGACHQAGFDYSPCAWAPGVMCRCANPFPRLSAQNESCWRRKSRAQACSVNRAGYRAWRRLRGIAGPIPVTL